MKLKIVRIADRGVPNKERLHLQVLADTDLKYFAIFDTVWLSPQGISNLPNNTYWFSPQRVTALDDVVLVTGRGQPSQAPNGRGGMTYFYYWKRPTTLWNAPEACAVLVELTGWETTPAL